MKIFKRMKDGGAESRVHGFFVIEAKRLFSIVLLRFADGSREAYHSHAFNSISWVLKGKLEENRIAGNWLPQAVGLPYLRIREYTLSLKPIITTRGNLHKVVSEGTTWVLSFRGPWAKTWQEYLPDEQRFITLTNGRKVVAE